MEDKARMLISNRRMHGKTFNWEVGLSDDRFDPWGSKTLSYSDNFEKALNPEIWKAEIALLPN